MAAPDLTSKATADLLASLAGVSQRLAVSVDLADTLRESVDYVASHLDAEAVSVFLVDPESAMLECHASRGPVRLEGLRLPADRGVIGRCVQQDQGLIVRDARADSDFNGIVDADTGFVTRSILCAPLTTAQGVIGAIQVINKRGDRLFDEDDLAALRVLAVPMALAVNTSRIAAELVEQQRIRRELGMARRLQRSLLPRRRRGAYPLRALNLAAQEISGDFYDFFDLPDGRIAFAVGDVAGKGLDAAFLMVRCASLMRWVGKEGGRPSDWLARVNDELLEAIAPGMFVCAAAGFYDPASHRAVWANAGFPPLLRVDAQGNIEQFDAAAPPLGILRRQAFPEQEADLCNASLCLYSDGVTDVRGSDDCPLGVEGVMALLHETRDRGPEARLRAMVRSLRALRVTDDITLMLISDGVRQRDEEILAHRFPAHPGELGAMRRQLAAALARAGVTRELRQTLVLAVDEACSNVIRHGYGGACDAMIELRVWRESDTLVFEILDDAPCADVERLTTRDLGEIRPGGLGLNLIDSLMDEWTMQARPGGTGNRLLMSKHLPLQGETK